MSQDFDFRSLRKRCGVTESSHVRENFLICSTLPSRHLALAARTSVQEAVKNILMISCSPYTMTSRRSLLFMVSLGVSLSLIVNCVQAEPIKYTVNTFKNCLPGFVPELNETTFCCPPQKNLNGPIVDFVPRHDPHKPLRIKKALQCLSGEELRTYTWKLQKGYELMRALPDDDPRSFYQQGKIHCAYGTGCFAQDSTNITLDVHYSFFFYPFHRYFLYFHEKILQKLLGDPSFTLHFWNYDNSITTSPPAGSRDGCFKAGHFFPAIYNDPTKATYSANRSIRAYTPNLVTDLGIPVSTRNTTSLPFEEAVARNRAVMHNSLITNATTSRAFLGRNYSVGDSQLLNPGLGDGSFEAAHASVHWWVGGIMGPVTTSASDPIFYAHHSNVDRLWTLWPKLGPNRHDPTSNLDWMDAEFLFWDENKVLRRVKVKDSSTTEAFGFRYQEVNDASWIQFPN
ncbi:hypothetical protein AXG93_3818s1390 [Marchantia polymorpha subsp. ruderalis]|uniref:Tyrosinase copper-binding domain-containing protein n=1 Tax=Marchantia polymorpha subsp. ruderalis TaxID=1480154 RepID=A0A176VIK0_MARPO|nr:hypothetical protein AXG93_3818s1390 [Marchantia polymorpha subsp. ruderalis]